MTSILCSKCGGFNFREGQRYCLACHRAYIREWRKIPREQTPEQKKKNNARAYARVALSQGRIKPDLTPYIERQPCVDCGEAKAEMHHEDYDKPLDVTWLCRACHLSRHRKEQQDAIQNLLAKLRANP